MTARRPGLGLALVLGAALCGWIAPHATAAAVAHQQAEPPLESTAAAGDDTAQEPLPPADAMPADATAGTPGTLTATPTPVPRVATAPPCLPIVDSTTIEPAAVRARVRNPCERVMAFGLSFVVLDGPDGQPLASTAAVHWEASPGDVREVLSPGLTSGGRAVLAQANGAPPGDDPPLLCEPVGASQCLPVDPWLWGALRVLQTYEPAQPLLRAAGEWVAEVRRAPLRRSLLGTYGLLTRRVLVSSRLDDEGDWERAATLLHELQHAADSAAGRRFLGRDSCYAREEDAFRVEAELWHALWKGNLPRQPTPVQTVQNDITRKMRLDPLRFVAELTELYEDECG